MTTHLDQLAAASDLAAAARLRRHSSLARAAQALELTADGLAAAAPAIAPAEAPDAWADDAAGGCLCPPGFCTEADCPVCHTLDGDLPCPADVVEPTPAAVTVDVGEVVVSQAACGVCLHLVADHNAADGWCTVCQCTGQPLTVVVVDEVDQDPPSMWEEQADPAIVHEVAAAQLAAAGYSVTVEELAPVRVAVDQAVERRAASPATGHLATLDWQSRHDPRSLAYGVRELAAPAGGLQLADVMMPVGPVLDQGADGACVGMAVVTAANVLDELAGNLDGTLLAEADAERLYRRAQQLDARAGEGYTGTSVLGGMRAAAEAGVIGQYLWAFGTRDIAGQVMQRHPVIVGIPWLSGMWETGPGGRVDVAGDDAGLGHCLTIVGLRMTGPQGQPGPWFVWQNTWGAGYGDGGLGYVHHRDLAQLLRRNGEAAVPRPVNRQ